MYKEFHLNIKDNSKPKYNVREAFCLIRKEIYFAFSLILISTSYNPRIYMTAPQQNSEAFSPPSDKHEIIEELLLNVIYYSFNTMTNQNNRHGKISLSELILTLRQFRMIRL